MTRSPEQLVPTAMLLVGAVRDGGPAQVAQVLDGLATAELPAIAVVLAAMVDPDKSPSELLAWVPDDLDAQVSTWEVEPEDLLDTVAIERACNGERVKLNRDERREAVRRLYERKLTDGAMARRLHMSSSTVAAVRRELGLPTTYAFGERPPRAAMVPDEPDVSKWTDEQVLDVARVYRHKDADKDDPVLRAAYLERERRRADRYRRDRVNTARSA